MKFIIKYPILGSHLYHKNIFKDFNFSLKCFFFSFFQSRRHSETSLSICLHAQCYRAQLPEAAQSLFFRKREWKCFLRNMFFKIIFTFFSLFLSSYICHVKKKITLQKSHSSIIPALLVVVVVVCFCFVVFKHSGYL